MKHIMIDLETTGLRQDRNSILQLAAVQFEPETREIVIDNMFNRCLQQVDSRPPDHDTIVNFWGRYPAKFDELCAKGEPAELVMTDFVQWVGFDGAIMWAKPSHFEQPWLESYFKDLKIPTPFHYRNTRDMYSFICGLFDVYHTDDIPQEIMDLKLEGTAHDAIYDSLHQIAQLFLALDIKETGVRQ